MNTQTLTKELVPNTSLVQLNLRLSDSFLDVALYNPFEDNSMILRSFPLEGDKATRLKQTEAAIYDNPLLLCEFQKTNILVENDRFIIVPSEIDPSTHGKLLHIAHPTDDDTYTSVSTDIPTLGVSILTAIDERTSNFLHRTFNNAPIISHLAPLMKYFQSKIPEGNTVKMLANLREGALDIIVMSHSRLILANRFSFDDINDAAYYILACAQHCMPAPEEILLSGTRETRDNVTPLVRRFHPYVMPLIFPSEIYRAGAAAVNSPFDLVIMPLCE